MIKQEASVVAFTGPSKDTSNVEELRRDIRAQIAELSDRLDRLEEKAARPMITMNLTLTPAEQAGQLIQEALGKARDAYGEHEGPTAEECKRWGIRAELAADYQPQNARCDHSGIGLPGCETCEPLHLGVCTWVDSVGGRLMASAGGRRIFPAHESVSVGVALVMGADGLARPAKVADDH